MVSENNSIYVILTNIFSESEKFLLTTNQNMLHYETDVRDIVVITIFM